MLTTTLLRTRAHSIYIGYPGETTYAVPHLVITAHLGVWIQMRVNISSWLVLAHHKSMTAQTKYQTSAPITEKCTRSQIPFERFRLRKSKYVENLHLFYKTDISFVKTVAFVIWTFQKVFDFWCISTSWELRLGISLEVSYVMMNYSEMGWYTYPHLYPNSLMSRDNYYEVQPLACFIQYPVKMKCICVE